MSEEITNASVAVPTSIMLSVLINGSMGFGMLIAMLFCSGDLEKALSSPTGYPFMSIFYQATGSIAGTAVMGSIVTTMGATTSVGMLASTSRQFWSFARDRGIPGWRVWSKVQAHRYYQTHPNSQANELTGHRKEFTAPLLGIRDLCHRLSSRSHQHRLTRGIQ